MHDTSTILLPAFIIRQRLLEHLQSLPLGHQEFSALHDIACTLIEIWSWLRDDGQVYPIALSLADHTHIIGPSGAIQALRRRDIPNQLIADLRSALELHFPRSSADRSAFAQWDDELHPNILAPFAISLESRRGQT